MRRSLSLSSGVLGLALLGALCGCTSTGKLYATETAAAGRTAADRLVVRSGRLVVSVESTDESARRVVQLVGEAGGYVERSTATRADRVELRCRVPATRLDATMDAVSALGETDHRSVSEADVTDEATDLETRLRNDTALRDRLQQLLELADDVEDILAVEKELNRIQSEIESLQARFDRLKGDVELSVLSVELDRERVLGPLGYVGYGLWWLVSKLFVIQ